MAEERDFRREELLEKYIAKILYIRWWEVWDRIFKEARKELVKIEVSFFREETLKER